MSKTNSDNNLQQNIDPNKPKKIIKGFVDFAGYGFFSVVNALRPPYLFMKKKAVKNLEINLAKGLRFPLNGQGMGELKDLRIGRYDFAHSGCGAVATFNALSMAGCAPKMHEVVDFYERKGLTLYGRFGVNPVAVTRFLATQDLSWKRYTKEKDWDACIEEGQSAILLYWWANAKGCAAHYVALEKLPEGIRVYNVYNTRDKAYDYKDVQTFLTTGSYKKVVAMFVIDTKKDKTTI